MNQNPPPNATEPRSVDQQQTCSGPLGRRLIVNYNTCPSCGGPGTRMPDETYWHCPNGSCDVKLFRNRVNGVAGEAVKVWQGRHKDKIGVVVGWTNTLKPQAIVRLGDGKDIEVDRSELELLLSESVACQNVQAHPLGGVAVNINGVKEGSSHE